MTMVCAIRRNRDKQKEKQDNLTEEHLNEYRDAFQMFDKDGKGYIITRELKSLLRCLGCNPTDFELQRIINEADADGNGKIDFKEFIALMENMTKPTEELASTLEAFRVFDSEGTGNINSKTIREIMLMSLQQVPKDDIYDILKNLNLIQDRVISYEEFSKLVTPSNLHVCRDRLQELSSSVNASQRIQQK